jgi:hypothetical protein
MVISLSQQFWDAERKKNPEAVQQEQLLASQPRAVGSDIGPEAVSDWINYFFCGYPVDLKIFTERLSMLL